jgi:hypothetical protein
MQLSLSNLLTYNPQSEREENIFKTYGFVLNKYFEDTQRLGYYYLGGQIKLTSFDEITVQNIQFAREKNNNAIPCHINDILSVQSQQKILNAMEKIILFFSEK